MTTKKQLKVICERDPHQDIPFPWDVQIHHLALLVLHLVGEFGWTAVYRTKK